MLKKSLIASAISLSIVSCSYLPVTPSSTSVNKQIQSNEVLIASQQANQLFDEMFNASVMRDPVMQTYLGIKADYDKWNDLSDEFKAQELAYAKADLKKLQAIDVSKLDAQTQISHQLYSQKLQNTIDDYQWRYHNYPVNQMFGTHSQIPAFLINQHTISNEKEALDYIARIQGSKKLLMQLTGSLKKRASLGIIAPKFVYKHVIRDCNNVIKGAPFDNGDNSTILADFSEKITQLDLTQKQKQSLLAKANKALITGFKPGYEQLISYLTELESKADNRAGVWKFPNGDAYFKNALKRTTTTNLTSDEIHQIGLAEVARIHQEMRNIKKKVGFQGDLKAFMQFMRNDQQFYYPNTDAGKKRYLDEAIALIDEIQARSDELFLTKPKAKLKVKRVEAFREQSSGKAFYQQPAPDGSRPGIYYANLYDMSAMPIYQMAALAYHEAIPGHHMQLAIMQELENMPQFRKFSGYTAYIEGWGLYSEYVPKEIGLYQDPYSDFGRLAMELWRACRLVVDTGIHTKKWTREQGIAYYVNNTPNAESDAIKMVERHIVMPSQATSYKIGMLEIIKLREKAKQALGDKFDIREYHDVVLKNGAVPLNVLADFVDDYIEKKR